MDGHYFLGAAASTVGRARLMGAVAGVVAVGNTWCSSEVGVTVALHVLSSDGDECRLWELLANVSCNPSLRSLGELLELAADVSMHSAAAEACAVKWLLQFLDRANQPVITEMFVVITEMLVVITEMLVGTD